MPRTTVPTQEQVPADSKLALDAFTKNIGFTPNMMASFAQSPIAFNSWAALLVSLSRALDVKTRDSIGLTVSEVNGCKYRLTVHSFTAEHMAKLPADEIIPRPKGPRYRPEARRCRPVCAQGRRNPGASRRRRSESCPRSQLHRCKRDGDRRVGGHVLAD
jgi:AhpD family alkylhydroperoxidase